MAQQTAVEWLINYCERENWSLPSEIEKIAIAMEKQQIKFAYNDGADAIVAGKYKSMDDYYNEMYQSSQDKTDK
jgi:hypothetical protein